MPELPTWEGIEFIAKWRVDANLGGCSAPVDAGLNFFDLQTGEMHVLSCTSERWTF